MGLEPNGKLPPPLGILEEVFQEKKIQKIFFKRLRYINFSKKLSKKSDPLDKVACRSYCTDWCRIFLGIFHFTYNLAVDWSLFFRGTSLYRATGDERSEVSEVKIAIFL